MQLVTPVSSYQEPPTVTEQITLSIIVPVYNEQEMLAKFHHELTQTLALLANDTVEIVYINDGSKDNSWAIMQALDCTHANVELINLSRNFGKEAAMTAGLELCKGDSAILLDADLQDPPALIPQMLDMWRQGFDVVNMRRKDRAGESYLKKLSAHVYYRLLNKLSDVDIATDVGDFRLLSRRVIDDINKLPEKNRYMKGIMAWPGYKQTFIEFDRPERVAGETKWSFLQLIQLGLSGITSFSVKPLKIATWLGGIVSLSAFIYSAFILLKSLFFQIDVAGYPSLMLIQLWLGGAQLMAIGLLGEYVGRIYTESKQRPVYLVMEKISHQTSKLVRVRGTK